MAKSRVTTNPMYTGGAGGYSFYVRGGEQVIRQRKNNSNYGEGASRTMAQMIRRIRWGNLVNVFKSQKAWQPKAYDSKTKGQTDYNIFMALNINQATVGFSKEMCEAGCAVIEGYQVSRGSLPPINISASGGGSYYVTDIKLSITISGTTTVGQLSTDILANNPQFVEGDNIALVSFKNWLTSRTEWPYAASSYSEITLEPSSHVLLNQVPVFGTRLSKNTDGYLQVAWSSAGQFDPTREVGFVAIHTRKSASMLAVSSQEILMNSNSLVSQFSGSEWDNQCILSYGLTDEVLLDPSFPEASISSVTANGSAVTEGVTLSGSQTVRIYGSRLNTRDVQLKFNDTEYTPLTSGIDFLEYLIGDNGTVKITLKGRDYLMFSVSGIVVPAELPSQMSMWQKDDSEGVNSGFININTVSSNCINYPYVSNAEYPNFLFRPRLGNSDEDIQHFTCSNCQITYHVYSDNYKIRLILAPLDASRPCYVMWKGFIVAVFNYSL